MKSRLLSFVLIFGLFIVFSLGAYFCLKGDALMDNIDFMPLIAALIGLAGSIIGVMVVEIVGWKKTLNRMGNCKYKLRQKARLSLMLNPCISPWNAEKLCKILDETFEEIVSVQQEKKDTVFGSVDRKIT